MKGGAKRGGGFRINEEIHIRQIRLVDAEGQMAGIVPVEDGLQMAREAGIDLVEVSPNADPPVCKILDYGKFKYEQKKREHEARKRQRGGELKEVRFRPKTDRHDKQIKIDRARSFLEDGHRVQLTMMFRGREMQHRDLGVQILGEIVKGLDDVAKVERNLFREGRRTHLCLMPKPNIKPKQPKQPEDSKEQSKRKRQKSGKESGGSQDRAEPEAAQPTG